MTRLLQHARVELALHTLRDAAGPRLLLIDGPRQGKVDPAGNDVVVAPGKPFAQMTRHDDDLVDQQREPPTDGAEQEKFHPLDQRSTQRAGSTRVVYMHAGKHSIGLEPPLSGCLTALISVCGCQNIVD